MQCVICLILLICFILVAFNQGVSHVSLLFRHLLDITSHCYSNLCYRDDWNVLYRVLGIIKSPS